MDYLKLLLIVIFFISLIYFLSPKEIVILNEVQLVRKVKKVYTTTLKNLLIMNGVLFLGGLVLFSLIHQNLDPSTGLGIGFFLILWLLLEIILIYHTISLLIKGHINGVYDKRETYRFILIYKGKKYQYDNINKDMYNKYNENDFIESARFETLHRSKIMVKLKNIS